MLHRPHEGSHRPPWNDTRQCPNLAKNRKRQCQQENKSDQPTATWNFQRTAGCVSWTGPGGASPKRRSTAAGGRSSNRREEATSPVLHETIADQLYGRFGVSARKPVRRLELLASNLRGCHRRRPTPCVVAATGTAQSVDSATARAVNSPTTRAPPGHKWKQSRPPTDTAPKPCLRALRGLVLHAFASETELGQ